MVSRNQIISPVLEQTPNRITGKVSSAVTADNLIVNFSKLKLTPVCIAGKFNNHFKNDQHFANVTANFLGVVLPKITSHTYKEICEGSPESKGLHFHPVDDIHRKIVREVLASRRHACYPFLRQKRLTGKAERGCVEETSRCCMCVGFFNLLV